MDKDRILEINLDFGNVMLLYAKSKFHSSWSVDMASRYVLPAIFSGQYLMIKDPTGIPLAYVSWAKFDLKREAEYLDNPHSLSTSDWNSGDRLWIIDWVSPIDKKITNELTYHLKHNIFPNSVARSLRKHPGEDSAKIKSYGGVNVALKDRKLALQKYYLELKEFSLRRQSKIIF